MKQKLNWTLLITLVMMSLSSFSQNATDTTKTIQLTAPIAKLIAKDLTRLDGILLENITLNQLIANTNSKVLNLTELVDNQQNQIQNLEVISENKDNQIGKYREVVEELESSIKKQQRKLKVFKLGTTIGAIALLLLLL